LAARCYLESLDSAETLAYIRAQISVAGGEPAKVFSEDALRCVYRASDGIPRLINQICDHALILASLGGVCPLNSDAIDEAWADLQQLPSPWSAPAAKGQVGADVVEFGGLDDPIDEIVEAIPFRAPAGQHLHVADPDDQLQLIEDHLAELDDDFQPAGMIGNEVELDFPEFGDPFSEEFAEEEVVLDRYSTDTEIFAEVPRVSSWEGRHLGSMLSTLSPAPQQSANPAIAVYSGSFPASISAPADDRDLIVIEDEPASRVQAPPAPRRSESRNLLSRLRRS
jgi:hypothetical protein